jgi:hypothetical protein
VKPRHASPQQPNGLSRGAPIRFNARAIDGIKNLKGAPELELNFIVRRHIKRRRTNTLPPFRNRPGPQRLSRTPLGTRPATGASRSCVALAKSASAPPLSGMHFLAIKVHNHCATLINEGSRDSAPVAGIQANSPRADVTAW